MDPFLNNNEGERAQTLGAQALEGMPSFDEHMKAKEEVAVKPFAELTESERPEGVRDEQDYREFLAEREAKRNEIAKTDREIMDGIRQIEDDDDRDLATAMLAACYNKYRFDDNDERDVHNIVGMEMLQTMIGYFNTDKEQRTNTKDDLDKKFAGIWKKYYGDGHGGFSKSNAVASFNERFDEFAKGCWIEGFASLPDGAEISFDTPFGGEEFFGVVKTLRGGEKFLRHTEMTGDIMSALAMAYDLQEEYSHSAKDTNGYYKDFVYKSKIGILADVVRDSGGHDSFEDSLENLKGRLMDCVCRETMRAVQRGNVDSDASFRTLKIPVLNSGAFRLAMLDEVESGFYSYRSSHKFYKKFLETGRRILNGEDWTELDPVLDA